MRPGAKLCGVGASISVVLHLAESALEEGRLAGEVEIVETSARGVVGDTNELVAFVQQHRPQPPTRWQGRQ